MMKINRGILGKHSKEDGKIAEKLAVKFFKDAGLVPIKIKDAGISPKKGSLVRLPQICDFILFDNFCSTPKIFLVDIKKLPKSKVTRSYFDKNKTIDKSGEEKWSSTKKQFINFCRLNEYMGGIFCFFLFVDIEKYEFYYYVPQCEKTFDFQITKADINNKRIDMELIL